MRGGVHMCLHVYDRDADCDPVPPARCDVYVVHYYTFVGFLRITYPNSSGKRKRASGNILPIMIKWDSTGTHFISPMCFSFPRRCEFPNADPFDIVDVIRELDVLERAAGSVSDQVSSHIITRLLTNEEKMGTSVPPLSHPMYTKCVEKTSIITPIEWNCSPQGECRGEKGEPYIKGEIKPCIVKPCPPHYYFDRVTCSCQPSGCPECPSGTAQVGQYPDCRCANAGPCPSGMFRNSAGDCQYPTSGKNATKVTIFGGTTTQFLCLKCVDGKMVVYSGDGDPDTGCPIFSTSGEFYMEGTGVRLRTTWYSAPLQPSQVAPGARCQTSDFQLIQHTRFPPYFMRFSMLQSDGSLEIMGEILANNGPHEYTGGGEFRDFGEVRRITHVWYVAIDEDGNEVDRGDFRPNPPHRIEPIAVPPTCVYAVMIRVIVGVLAVRYNGVPGVRPPYKNIDFRSLPKVGVSLPPIQVSTFTGPCVVNEFVFNAFLGIASAAASAYVNASFDALLTAALGPVGGLVGAITDLGFIAYIERR